MSDTEILEAIIAHKLWVHPSRRGGWTVTGDGGEPFVWNQPTLRGAVHDAIRGFAAPSAATEQ
jgi:hypothetical protein